VLSQGVLSHAQVGGEGGVRMHKWEVRGAFAYASTPLTSHSPPRPPPPPPPPASAASAADRAVD